MLLHNNKRIIYLTGGLISKETALISHQCQLCGDYLFSNKSTNFANKTKNNYQLFYYAFSRETHFKHGTLFILC